MTAERQTTFDSHNEHAEYKYDESFESDGITITDETTPSLAHSFEQDTVETPSESQKKDALASFINTAIGKVRRKTYFSQLEKRVSKEKASQLEVPQRRTRSIHKKGTTAERPLAREDMSFNVPNMSNGPTDLWKRKLKTLFRCVDADGNGELNRKDLPVLAAKFKRYGEMTDEAMQEFAKKLEMWWDAAFDKNASLSFEGFMESRIEMMKPSKADDDMEKHFKPSLEMMFHAIDLNGDGIISLPEWKIYYKAMGIHDDKKAEESFKVVDLNSDGDMSLEEFIAGSLRDCKCDAFCEKSIELLRRGNTHSDKKSTIHFSGDHEEESRKLPSPWIFQVEKMKAENLNAYLAKVAKFKDVTQKRSEQQVVVKAREFFRRKTKTIQSKIVEEKYIKHVTEMTSAMLVSEIIQFSVNPLATNGDVWAELLKPLTLRKKTNVEQSGCSGNM